MSSIVELRSLEDEKEEGYLGFLSFFLFDIQHGVLHLVNRRRGI